MGRKSKLTPKEWEKLEKRLLAGESAASLAKEYGIDRAAITRKFAQQLRNVKDVANQIVTTEAALSKLPLSQQVQAISHADDIKRRNANMSESANDVSIAAKMWARAAKDATSQIMFKSMGDDGVTVCPERLAACADEATAVMKSIIVVNEASKLPLKLIEIESKSKEPIEQPKDEPPVRFYIPQNGRD
jgi:hypothetical protein